MRWIGKITLVVVGLGMAVVMGCVALMQDDAIRHDVPMRAKVVSSTVSVSRGRRSSTYTPRVHYKYTVRGVEYESDQIKPYGEGGGSGWAHGIARRFRAGQEVTAYVDPENPKEAILLREYSNTPYMWTIVGIWVAAVGFGVPLGLGGRNATMRAVALGEEGWSLLLPVKSVKKARRDAVLAMVFTGVPTAVLLTHMLLVQTGMEFFGWFVSAVCAGLVVLEAVLLFRAWSISRHMSDPRVLVNPAPLVVGKPFSMRVEFDAHRALRVEAMTASVVCVEHYKERSGNKTVIGTRTFGQRELTLGENRDVGAGEVFSGEGEVEPDRGWPATGGAGKYPHYTWEVRVKVGLLKMADYGGVFPLTAVSGGGGSEVAAVEKSLTSGKPRE